MSLTLFKYADPTPGVNTLFLSNAQAVKGFSSLMWIERYRNSGEFTITAPVSSSLRQKLPLGSLISHTDTQELMIVESHEISDTVNGEVNIVITGRSFETFMENRTLSYFGATWPGQPLSPEPAPKTYNFSFPGKVAAHLVDLIESHCRVHFDAVRLQHITNLRAVSTVPTSVGVETTRELKIQDLYSAVIELLSIDDLGIKSVRPGPMSGLPLSTDIGFIIHQGLDRTKDVAFDHASGDIQNGQYLWSIKQKKNSAVVSGENYRVFQLGVGDDLPYGYFLRTGFLDASDIATGNSGVDQVALVDRATSYLSTNKEKNIARVEVNPTINRLRYRKDYSVGDLVAVTGNYDTAGVMRVVEHVEIIDKTGHSNYPTLEAI